MATTRKKARSGKQPDLFERAEARAEAAGPERARETHWRTEDPAIVEAVSSFRRHKKAADDAARLKGDAQALLVQFATGLVAGHLGERGELPPKPKLAAGEEAVAVVIQDKGRSTTITDAQAAFLDSALGGGASVVLTEQVTTYGFDQELLADAVVRAEISKALAAAARRCPKLKDAIVATKRRVMAEGWIALLLEEYAGKRGAVRVVLEAVRPALLVYPKL